jgi:hypothetical protein
MAYDWGISRIGMMPSHPEATVQSAKQSSNPAKSNHRRGIAESWCNLSIQNAAPVFEFGLYKILCSNSRCATYQVNTTHEDL